MRILETLFKSRTRHCLTATLILAATAYPLAIGPATAAEKPRPNVLFITADDLNWDSLGVQHFLYRVPEEFYDYENDPCALKNLIDQARHTEGIGKLRRQMLEIMRSIEDPLVERLEKVAKERSQR